jgi:sec-independent protein translocase protein TatA
MGITGISVWQLLIVLLIIVLLFGTKRLRDVGGDMGAFIKSFRKGLKDDAKPGEASPEAKPADEAGEGKDGASKA